MGGLSGSIWDFIKWNQINPNEGYEEFQVTAFTNYLRSLFAQMKSAGMNQIELSFSQLCDLDAYSEGNFSKISVNDAIAILLQQMITSDVHFPSGVDILNLITTTANQLNMKVALSFGGENASPADFVIVGPGDTPEGQAAKLSQFMQKYGIASVDFDVEGINAAALSNEMGAAAFFLTLNDQLSSMGKTSTLTIQGSLTQTVWGSTHQGDDPKTFNGPLKPLFYDQNDQPIFYKLFSGLNLMMYDNGSKYYLDAKIFPDDILIPDWCIEDWLTIIEPVHAGLVHIGFQDATKYQLNSSSASGHTYDEPNDPTDPLAVKSTDPSGVAGAKIFLQIQRQLIEDGYTAPLGAPFWWPNYDPSRYAPGPSNQAQFISQPMIDFYSTLQNLEICR